MEDQPSERINLNTASEAELVALPGIGPALARDIVADREENGPFREVADITRVAGVGQRVYGLIRELAYVAEEASDSEVQPIVFYGEASSLRGIVPIVNLEDRPTRRTRLCFEKFNLSMSTGSLLTEIVVRIPRPGLQPGERARANVTLALDSSTPPGIHRGELVIGEERRQVIFHVAEKLKVNFAPTEIFIDNAPGSKVEKTVFVTNLGNVPITINNVGAVEIEETAVVHHALHDAISQLEGSGIDVALDAFTSQLKEGLNRRRILRIRTKNKPVEVPAGEVRPLELEISLPETMPARYYEGEIRLYDSSIRLVIQPTFASGPTRLR